MKKAIVFCILAMAAAAPVCGFTISGNYTGTTNYVSKSGNDANDGKSWATAKKTIQAAVDLCADGDTVIVDDGEYSDTTAWTASGYNNPAVVQITKRIHLVSRNGKAKTHIVGQLANTTSGVANDGTAHRCIYVSNIANVLIEGFTIRNGATAGAAAGNNTFDSAGGVCGASSSTGYLVDCDVVNCRAGVGAALSRGIVPIRCAFVGNYSVKAQYVFYRTTGAYNCVIANNGPTTRDGACFASVQGVKAVNCTFIDNTCAGFTANDNDPARTHRVWNCAFLGANETGGTHGNTYFTNCVQTATGGRIGTQGAAAGCKAGVSEIQHYYAADADAWRFLSGGDLYDAGLDDARAIAATFVPEEYLDTDFFGNPRKVGAHVDIGAIESQSEPVAAPASGYIQLGQGVAVRNGDTLVSFPRGLIAVDADMQQVRLVPTIGDSTPFFGFKVTGDWTEHYRYPDRNGDRGAWLTPPAPGETVSVRAQAAAGEAWVQADYTGGDSDGTEARPYTDITEAVAAVPEYGLVRVKPGVYATGGAVPEGHKIPARVAIDKSVAVRAEGGAGDTSILGDAGTRCVSVRRKALDCHIQGFTIAGGTAAYGNGNDADNCGGGFYTTAQAWSDATGLPLHTHCSHVTDCVFSSNVARRAGAMWGGWAQRCVFTGNRIGDSLLGRGAVAGGAIISACLVTNNLQAQTGSICSLYHCAPHNVTFAESNKCANASTDYRPVDMNTPAFNCAFLGGYLDKASASVLSPAGNVGDTTLDARGTWLARYERDDLFVDPAAGDLRLKPGTGSAFDGDGTVANAALFAVGDFEGNALQYVNGNPVPGAYSDVDTAPRDWYVDANGGNDDADGTTAATAKRTLAAILPLAGYGDTVHAAAGDYDEGTATYDRVLIAAAKDGRYSPARGVVRAGVALVADEGPDVTFVTGAFGTGNGNRLGDDAVRCLTMLPKSSVRGFTLRTGSTFHTTGDERDENMGGGVLAPACADASGTALIEDCVITNCAGRTAGCVAGGVLRRCTVAGGKTTSGSNLSMHSRFEHCLLLNLDPHNTGIRYCGGMASTTFVSTGEQNHKTNGELRNALSGARFENSVLLTRNTAAEDGSHPLLKNVRNCIWCVGGGRMLIDDATSANVITGTLETALLDAARGYRPLPGSPAIDAGDQALLANLEGDAATDFTGLQRVYNGQVDIGAYEYDIRPAMAALLHKNAAVTAAAPSARLVGETIQLPSGEVAATFASSSTARFLVPVQVTGTGTFAVYVGDSETPAATATAADGAKEVRLAVPAGEAARFVYEPGADDAGAAILGAFANASGMTVIFR